MKKLNKDNLKDILLKIDEEFGLIENSLNYKPIIMIVGSCAFILQDLSSRAVTHDIDVIRYDSALSSILNKYNAINSQVIAYEDSLPYNYEDRLIYLDIGAKNIDFITPSLEDLVVMKLYGARPNDIQDITSEAVVKKIDWDLMDYLVFDHNESYSSNLIKRRYNEMVDNYIMFAKENNHEPNIKRFS